MKRIYFTFFLLFIAGLIKAQNIIKLEDVSRHIGDSVTVCGKVDDMRYFENSKNQPTFLNIGGNYPNQLLTVVIWGEIRKQFTGNLDDLKTRQICITGRIILYKEKAEIVIGEPGQIVVQ